MHITTCTVLEVKLSEKEQAELLIDFISAIVLFTGIIQSGKNQ